MSRTHDRLKEQYPDTLILRLVGRFFSAYEDSARVLSALTGYKIRKVTVNAMPKTNFPADNTLDKVIRILEAEHVNYIVWEKEREIASKVFDDNAFERILQTFDESSVYYVENRKLSKYLDNRMGASGETAGTDSPAELSDKEPVEEETHEIIVHCSADTYKRINALASRMGIDREHAIEAAVGLAISSGLTDLGY